LKTALDDAAAAWQAENRDRGSRRAMPPPRRWRGGSRAERRPTVFASADLAWMSYLEGKGLIKAGSRINTSGQ
jgi:hypothetical protein